MAADPSLVRRQRQVPSENAAHRKDTINALLDGCERSGRVHFHLGEQITELDFDGVRLRRKDGSWAD